MAYPLVQRCRREFLNFASIRMVEVKAKTILYWTTTWLIALETFAGGVMDLTHGRTGIVSGPFVTQVVTGLGYPMYVLAIIGIYKIPGAVTLVIPGFLRVKEWAYAGIAFELSGAAASHAARGNWGELIAPLSLLCLAIASWSLRPPSRMTAAPACIRHPSVSRD